MKRRKQIYEGRGTNLEAKSSIGKDNSTRSNFGHNSVWSRITQIWDNFYYGLFSVYFDGENPNLQIERIYHESSANARQYSLTREKSEKKSGANGEEIYFFLERGQGREVLVARTDACECRVDPSSSFSFVCPSFLLIYV